MNDSWRPNLQDADTVLGLKPREAPYFNILQYCRHLGLQVTENGQDYWVARVRTKCGGYRQKRLCTAFVGGSMGPTFREAKSLAEAWFATPEVARIASEPYQVGSKRGLSICPFGLEYSEGHALEDYVEWKMLAATKSHFETLVSLINYHLVPRISHVKLADFNGSTFHQLAKDVLETPPKYGRKTPKERIDIRQMSQSQLRRRKKTFNALVSILRGAFEVAWERGHLDNDRPMRCLRRLPNIDRPRVVFLDANECTKLLDSCDPDLRQLVQAALYTGCRANELTTLTVGDFQPQNSSVFISSPKGHRTRHVILPRIAVRFFEQASQGKTRTERIFRKENGRLWGAEYKSYFQRARTTAGLPKNVTFHGLRHTYASRLLEGGVSLVTVADQLGHTNTQTVGATYGHLTSKRKVEEIEFCFAEKMPFAEPELGAACSPMFRHYSQSSWPRSNHSKYAGPLLRELRPLTL